MNKYPAVILLFFIGIYAVGCSRERMVEHTEPTMKNGFLDLSEWCFASEGTVELRGDWYANHNHDSALFSAPSYDYFHWSSFTIPGYMNSISSSGFGTFWLRSTVIVPKDKSLSFFLYSCLTSYELFINGKLLMAVGVAGNSRQETVPMKIPMTVPLPYADTLHIVWKISNFHDKFGGASVAPVIGRTAELYAMSWKRDLLMALLLGAFLIMGGYHIILWLGRRRDDAPIYFAILCFSISLRLILQENLLQRMFPSVSLYVLHIKLEYLTLPVVWSMLVVFFNRLFPRHTSPLLSKFLILSAFLSAGYILLSPVWVFSDTQILFQVMVGITGVFLLVTLTKASLAKEQGASVILIGSILFLCTALNDIFEIYGITSLRNTTPLGLLAFIFAQSSVLSLRFSKAFTTVEYLSENLEKEVKLKTRELENQRNLEKDAREEAELAKGTLEQIHEQRTRFYQNVTHEFRTPLTCIVSPLDTMLRGDLGAMTNPLRNHLELVRQNAGKLLHLINQLLDLARLDAGVFQGEQRVVDIEEFVRYIAALFQSHCDDKKIDLKVTIPGSAEALRLDVKALEAVVTNLVSNAIKFTSAGGCITIFFNRIDQQTCSLTVQDTGVGIPEKDIALVFDRFKQVDTSTTRKFYGTGIGLSIVKEYVKVLNGNVVVASKENEGTVFTVTLPVAKENIEDIDWHPLDTNQTRPQSKNMAFVDKDNTPSKTPVKQYTVLLAEDNDDLRVYIETQLSTKYHVLSASNGSEAWEKIKLSGAVDLIISDLMMPEMDGTQLLGAIRSNQKMKAIPFIFLTARDSLDDKLSLLKKGAVDFISKPFDLQELFTKIDSWLQLTHVLRSMHEQEHFASIGRLAAAMTHEIMNPLSSISGPVQFLEQVLTENGNESSEEREAFSYIYKNIERISKVLKTLKTIITEQIEIQHDIPLADVFEKQKSVMTQNKQEGTLFTYNILPDFRFTGNLEAMLLVLNNILKNAFDAVGEKGRVSLEAFDSDGLPVIKVKDNGCGIAPEHISLIFDLYFTTKPPSRGSGLGLYFVKDLLAKMGWSVRVESKLNDGTTFTLLQGIEENE